MICMKGYDEAPVNLKEPDDSMKRSIITILSIIPDHHSNLSKSP